MYRSGGYLIGYGAGGIVEERDSFTCSHCGAVTFVGARERAADIGGFCRCCAGLICGPCADDGMCKTIERRLEEMERREDTLRSYGLA